MIDNKKIIKIYYAPRFKENRETMLINQGLVNNSRIELVNSERESDFVFQFVYPLKHKNLRGGEAHLSHKTVLIDYVDNPHWFSSVECLAYFKRSWVESVRTGEYTVRKPISWPANFYPLTMAIIDEFIIDDDMERDVMLSCTLRKVKGHLNRKRVLEYLENMNIRGKTQIGEFNAGHMRRFNAPDMREYFKLLKRSRIVVTCNPGKWEGDHRTWEAFANGALVFVDRTLTPLRHPLIDGEHCIFYDLSDHGLSELRKKIFYFMEHIAEAEAIARAGFDFTMKYHRVSNRIDEILEVIT